MAVVPRRSLPVTWRTQVVRPNRSRRSYSLHHGDRGKGLLDEAVEPAFDLLLLIPALQHRLRISAKHDDHERQNREGEQRERAVHSPYDHKHRT